MDQERLQRDVEACTTAHQRLLATLEGLTDDEAWAPSVLPGWTVGHVLTHLARNADGQVRMLRAAEIGAVAHQYEGGAAGRAADIDAGASRPAEALVADVEMSVFHLEQVWSVTTERGWTGKGITVAGELPSAVLPYRRWVEVEIHHTDLDLGYGCDDWPDDFVRRELSRLTGLWSSRKPMGLTELPAAVLALSPSRRLAWMAGRLDVDGVEPAGILR